VRSDRRVSCEAGTRLIGTRCQDHGEANERPHRVQRSCMTWRGQRDPRTLPSPTSDKGWRIATPARMQNWLDARGSAPPPVPPSRLPTPSGHCITQGAICQPWTPACPQLRTNGAGSFANPAIDVNAGDTIYGEMLLEEGSTEYGDKWLVSIEDTTTAQSSYFFYYTGGSGKPLTQAWEGVLEVHGLEACSGLSKSNEEAFYLNYLTQEKSESEKTTQVNVIPFTVWGAASAPTTKSPYCSWSASNVDIPSLGWQWALLEWSY
jgi:hypothetical protein